MILQKFSPLKIKYIYFDNDTNNEFFKAAYNICDKITLKKYMYDTI